jgi:nanoRNase/pAp phosphatase (c-di-AMP/oligoRNAs hydrolase)
MNIKVVVRCSKLNKRKKLNIYMEGGKSGELEKVLEEYSGKKILISLRGAPDPDCISSAIAHQLILNEKGIESEVSYSQKISHQQNKALMKLLGIQFREYDENFDVESFDGYSLVDSQLPDDLMVDKLKSKDLVSIVDHHDVTGEHEALFSDVRKDVGSTATIYAEYLKDLNILDSGNKNHVVVATALMHGIRTDTDNLLKAKPIDYVANSFLSEYADLNLLRAVSFQLLSPQTMDVISLAHENKKVYGSYLLTGAGFIRGGERDSIPQASDFLIQREGTHTVLVYGIVDGNIDCSLRTTSDKITPSDFIKTTFPEVEDFGSYGGREDKGGFAMKLGPVLSYHFDLGNKEIVEKAVDGYMDGRFREAIGENGKE